MGFRGLVYRLYARRLETSLSPEAIPRHVGVMFDGNRRWARSAGLLDGQWSSDGRRQDRRAARLVPGSRRRGRHPVAALHRQPRRPAEELDPLLRIIETPSPLSPSAWRLNPMGALDLLPARHRRVLKDAADATEHPGMLVNVASATAAGARSPTPYAPCCTSTPPAAGDRGARRDPRRRAHRRAPLHGRASPTPTWSSGPPASSARGLPALADATRSSTSARRTGPTSAVDFLRALRAYAARQRRFGA